MPGSVPGSEESSSSMARPRKYPKELLDRGARVVIDSGQPIAHVARNLGIPPRVAAPARPSDRS